MFLRWMVRQDDQGVDFGIWRKSGWINWCALVTYMWIEWPET